jgi:protein-disulfide isomerase
MKENNINQVAVAIVIAGLIIAGSIFITNNSNNGNVAGVNDPGNGANAGNAVNLDNFRKVQSDDHLRGNPNAKVTIVEFSDFECPFCSRIHPNINRVISERDNVNWVYRHFPLTSIHSRALGAAIASECISDLAGNDAFWEFTDNAFSDQSQLGESFYESQAVSFGINSSAFNSCINSEEIANRVTEDLDEVVASGGRGTPYSVIITPKGNLIPFSGALPYENILALVDNALAE